MRKVRVILVLVFGLVLAGTVFMVIHDAPLPFVTLADGTILRVEQVTYGKRENYRVERGFERLKQDIASHLPKKWGDRLAKPPAALRVTWENSLAAHTNLDSLHIWMTHHDAAGNYLDVSNRYAQIVDEHGCIFHIASEGGEDDGRLGPLYTAVSNTLYSTPRSIANWLRFEAFPRQAKTLSLKIFGYEPGVTNFDEVPHVIAEFAVHNPNKSVRRAPGWAPETLPIVKETGDVTFVLKSLQVETNFGGITFVLLPTFEVRSNGQGSDAWGLVNMELSDSSGNLVGQPLAGLARLSCLCFKEPAWKLTAKIVGPPETNPGSNSVWTIRNVSVPARGEFTALEGERNLSGASIKLIALSGTGRVVYSNGVVVQASVQENARDSFTSGVRGLTFDSTKPQLSFAIADMSEDQRMSVCATDEQGRRVYGRLFRSGPSRTNSPIDPARIQYLSYARRARPTQPPNIVALELPTDARTVDLTFWVHDSRMVDFVFKPPQK
jgi:hypothetical protein